MSKAARNEQRKIEAAYLNNVGAGIILVGGFLPVFTIVVLEAPPTNDRLIAGAIFAGRLLGFVENSAQGGG